jgi:hypothetical protein
MPRESLYGFCERHGRDLELLDDGGYPKRAPECRDCRAEQEKSLQRLFSESKSES